MHWSRFSRSNFRMSANGMVALSVRCSLYKNREKDELTQFNWHESTWISCKRSTIVRLLYGRLKWLCAENCKLGWHSVGTLWQLQPRMDERLSMLSVRTDIYKSESEKYAAKGEMDAPLPISSAETRGWWWRGCATDRPKSIKIESHTI